MKMFARTMEMNVASAAPVTPRRGNGPIPKIRKGARMMLMMTVNPEMVTVGFMIPVARKADPSATSGNCIINPGMNQRR